MSAVGVPVGRGTHVRIERRTLVASLLLVATAAAAGFAGLCLGDGWSSPRDVAAALAGGGPIDFVVTRWRLPRVVGGLAFGAALGLAGAVFQNLTRNPLGSPDVIGLDAGAYTGTLLVLTVGTGTATGVAAGSVAAGLATAALIYVLSLRSGFSGLRLVVVGIGVNAVLTGVNSWIVLRADLDVAIAATAWSAGSLNGLGWEDLGLPLTVVGALAVLLALASHPMHQLALGDEVARTSGVALSGLRLLLVVVGVGLTATVTAVAGPIVFIALVAPQVGRRLVRAAGVPLLPAALVGATLLTGSDVVAQALLAPVVLPVGVVTTAVGGAYLMWLLAREVKR